MPALNAVWRKSRHSTQGPSCVEVRLYGGQVQVRDTKLGEASPILSFTPAEWEAFTAGAKDGEFDLP